MVKKLDEEIYEKIDALEERITKVRAEYEEVQEKHEGKPADDETPELRLGRRAGSMFLGNVFAGFILGLLIDKYLGIAPWGMMSLIILGFVAGVYRAQSLLKKNE
jgi:ATP synthase protein I